MYSGTTLHNKSGNFIGAHQKFDRVARKFVSAKRPESNFPGSKQILHFEGNNGPDGVKRKSTGKDEPWHFWDPTNPDDTILLKSIRAHYDGLVKELAEDDLERSAFEAAWMAHAIVDGLTPAHHYPYEEKLLALRGEGKETRTSVKAKAIIKGDTRRQTLVKNWKTWGAKGLMISHAYFEFGVSSTVRPMRFTKHTVSEADIKHARNLGLEKFMKEQALEIYNLDLYERFLRRGWTMKIAKQIRTELAPRIVRAIALAWIMAIDEANE